MFQCFDGNTQKRMTSTAVGSGNVYLKLRRWGFMISNSGARPSPLRQQTVDETPSRTQLQLFPHKPPTLSISVLSGRTVEPSEMLILATLNQLSPPVPNTQSKGGYKLNILITNSALSPLGLAEIDSWNVDDAVPTSGT